MATTDALYQELILDHNRKPKNFRVMDDADRTVRGNNPMCGDQLTLWLKFNAEGAVIDDISFQGQGCAISRASASMMTAAVKGKTRAEANALFDSFRELVTGTIDADHEKALGSLRALGGVSKFPLRVKCASLAWHALHSALQSPTAETPTITTDAGEGGGEGA
jgi:nitrogen fixation NifU-like protein